MHQGSTARSEARYIANTGEEKKKDDVFSPHSLHAEFYTLEDFPQPSVSLGDEGVAKLQ